MREEAFYSPPLNGDSLPTVPQFMDETYISAHYADSTNHHVKDYNTGDFAEEHETNEYVEENVTSFEDQGAKYYHDSPPPTQVDETGTYAEYNDEDTSKQEAHSSTAYLEGEFSTVYVDRDSAIDRAAREPTINPPRGNGNGLGADPQPHWWHDLSLDDKTYLDWVPDDLDKAAKLEEEWHHAQQDAMDIPKPRSQMGESPPLHMDFTGDDNLYSHADDNKPNVDGDTITNVTPGHILAATHLNTTITARLPYPIRGAAAPHMDS
ncbi:hypothetical protein K439DRAFT_1625224 [Ramaria rubella]|nr:hypothetical protein K439DRAFT_1625224 [Ramaria rubella]